MVVFQIRPGWPEYRAKPIACSFTSSTGTGSDSPRYSTGSPTRRSVPVTYDGVMRASVLPAVPQAMNPFIFPSRGLVRSCHPPRSPATPRPVGKPSRGYDAGKKVNGRKRHVAVDTIGLLLSVLITAAGVQDRGGAKPLLWNLELGTCGKPSPRSGSPGPTADTPASSSPGPRASSSHCGGYGRMTARRRMRHAGVTEQRCQIGRIGRGCGPPWNGPVLYPGGSGYSWICDHTTCPPGRWTGTVRMTRVPGTW